MSVKILIPPTVEPLDIAEVRAHLKQDVTDDDNLIAIYLSAARQFAEAKTWRTLVSTRYQDLFDGFPNSDYADRFKNSLQLSQTPLIQLVSIEYLANDGILQTLPDTDYTIDYSCDPARIALEYGKSWPSTLPQINSVKITYDAGYVAPFTADATANRITVIGWKTLNAGDSVRLSNSGGFLPAPLKIKTDYFIQSVVSPGVYTLAATSGGTAIDFTNAGTGLNFLGQAGINGSSGEIPDNIKTWMMIRCDSLYSHRGEIASTRGMITPLPWVDHLLDRDSVVLQ